MKQRFRKIKILGRILKETNTDRMLSSFVLFVLICAFIFQILEPGIHSIGEGLWFCYAVISTAGFGDIVVHSMISRILTIFLSVYSILVIAIITGVVVNYFNQLTNLRNKESLQSILDQLEHLEDLDKEELAELSENIRRLRTNKKKED